MFFTPGLSWNKACKELAEKADRASNMLLGFIFKTKLNVKDACFLFDRMVSPILTYCSEVWGHTSSQTVENVHLKFCKRLLSVGLCTSNAAVYGELGRFPLHIIYMVNLIKYWLKITQMPMSRYPKSCYIMLYKLDEGGRTTWATYVKMLLNNYGFSHVWLEQGVSNVPLFVEIFKQRLKDCWVQKWNSDICTKLMLNLRDTEVLSLCSKLKSIYSSSET